MLKSISIFSNNTVKLLTFFSNILLYLYLFGVCSEAQPLHTEFLDQQSYAFSNPQRVIIRNLPNGFESTEISTEEPFISRDGRYLFFNSGEKEGAKDLYYAELKNEDWVFQGAVDSTVNSTSEVQGNPSMDTFNRFYFIDSSSEQMVKVGDFKPALKKLEHLRDVLNIPGREVEFFSQRVSGNMGVEVSADGKSLYFDRATWKLKGFTLGIIIESDIMLATKKDENFVYDEGVSKQFLANINTPDLEYAESLSTDGKEIFLTKLKRADLEKGIRKSSIMQATRSSLLDPFGTPKPILSIGSEDFVEGPSISNDGKELYYHKLVGEKFQIFKVTRTTLELPR